jgi:hypothetical protein
MSFDTEGPGAEEIGFIGVRAHEISPDGRGGPAGCFEFEVERR